MKKWSARSAALAAAILASACATVPQPQPATSATDELTKALKEAAQRAADARIRLAGMQPMPLIEQPAAGAVQAVPAEALMKSGARIDVDYVGDVEKATQLISRILGWDFKVTGKKRADVIVSLRHNNQDGVSIFQDIGAQCGHRCDVHVELVEAGRSSVGLTFRD